MAANPTATTVATPLSKIPSSLLGYEKLGSTNWADWKTSTLVVLRLLGIDVDQLQASGDVKAGEHDGTAWGLVMLTLGDVQPWTKVNVFRL